MNKKVIRRVFWLLPFFILMVFFVFAVVETRKDLTRNTQGLKKLYAQSYNFSEDYFSHALPTFEQALSSYKGKPDVRYLEIGVFEGASLIWVLENILTHSSSMATGIDTFGGDLLPRFSHNLKLSGSADKVKVVKGSSQVELRYLPLDYFDIIYIDGSHETKDVLTDAVLSWGLLKRGGIMIFDDYLRETAEEAPKAAIDSFLTCFKEEIKIINMDYLIVLKKK